MTLKGEITIEYYAETREYLAVWEPVVLGMGPTRQAALEDLTAAANLFMEVCTRNTGEIKED